MLWPSWLKIRGCLKFFLLHVYELLIPRGVASLHQGVELAGFMLGTTRHCYRLIIQAVSLVVSEGFLCAKGSY